MTKNEVKITQIIKSTQQTNVVAATWKSKMQHDYNMQSFLLISALKFKKKTLRISLPVTTKSGNNVLQINSKSCSQ